MSSYRIVFELDELRLEAYKNSLIYKHKVKQFHDKQILRKEFQVGQKVLLFKSRKLRSRWDGHFVITNVFSYGAVELKDEHTNNTFWINGHQIKLFHEGVEGEASQGLPNCTIQNQLNCHVTLEKLVAQDMQRSRTERSKVIKGDHLACYRTLVDLILSILTNRGEPSLFDHGDLCGRRTHQIHTLNLKYYQPKFQNWVRIYKGRSNIVGAKAITSSMLLTLKKVELG
ncbi:hypothetical protein CR513_01002, partial [Mucuna pruriens]